MDNGPPGPHWKSIMLEFCLRALIDGCDFFLWTLSNELRLRETLNQETITKLETYSKELKSELTKVKDSMDQWIWAAEQEKAHLAAKEQALKEQLQELWKDKENLEKDWKERLQ